MKIRFFLVSLAFLMVTGLFSQTNLNSYKYIIVPKKYEFLKEANQYRINELTEFLFKKYGFLALMEGDNYPDDLLINRCLALKSDLIKDSSLFKTRLKIELKDCNDRIVYASEQGESREKDYEKAYNEALRNAFQFIEALNYKYVPSEKVVTASLEKPVTSNDTENEEIQKLKAELEALKHKKEDKPQAIDVVEAVEVPSNKDIKIEPKVVAVISENKVKEKLEMVEVTSNVLYAQAIENGFQLVDSSPKVVYRIKKTGLDHAFLVENLEAILYKKGDQWILEYYKNGSLKQDILNIKF